VQSARIAALPCWLMIKLLSHAKANSLCSKQFYNAPAKQSFGCFMHNSRLPIAVAMPAMHATARATTLSLAG